MTFEINDGRRIEVRWSQSEDCSDIVVIQHDGAECVFSTYNGRGAQDHAITKGQFLARRLNADTQKDGAK